MWVLSPLNPSTPLLKRLCRNSVHGSRTSPRTENDILKINQLAVRPEYVEGRMANYDTGSKRRGEGEGVPISGLIISSPPSFSVQWPACIRRKGTVEGYEGR
jgi:hypothetical protein